jgi:LysR family transcriptional activator of glutamate synthase operon
MDLRQLQSFVAVAEELQFTRAASRMGIAQSSLSAQIRQLERELGLPVFDRTTRHVALTDAGELLLERARLVLAAVDEMTADLQRVRGILSGRVSIGLTQTPGPIDVVRLLTEFSTHHPAIELSVREDLSVHLAKELREDRLDIGFLTITEPADCRALHVEPLAQEDLVAIVAPDHELADRVSLPIDALQGQRLVVSPPGATIRKAVTAAARDAGITLDIGFESREVTRIRAIVAAGLAIAVLPRSDANTPGPEVKAIPFEDAALVHQISLCWRDGRRHSPAAQALLAEARRLYQRTSYGAQVQSFTT